MTATPWMKFYPADWRADPALRMCSLAARGLWMEMLAIMHEATPRGDLLVNGRPVTPAQLASLSGCPVVEIDEALSELGNAGVFSVRRNGVIYSRRMERDEIKSRKNRANGKMGGNPSLGKQREKTGSDNPPDKAQKPEARSQIPEGSVSNETGSEALPDCREILFGKVKAYLVEAHRMSDRNARSFIGRCLKLTGDDAGSLIDLFREAARVRPAEIESWVMARLRPVERKDPSKRTVDEIIADANLYGDRLQ